MIDKSILHRRTLLISAVALTATTILPKAFAFEAGKAIPAPETDQAKSTVASQVMVVAGGCFWGVQGVFQHTTGVIQAVSGYAGGMKKDAEYHTVGGGNTGHAEAVEITYDPSKITYGKLLQVFFAVAHNPTQLKRQGPDTGTQYRSAIFPLDDEQATVAKAYIAQLNKARVFDAAVVTKVEPGKAFYRAENYHQDYMTLNPREPYIAYNDLPKIGELQRYFPDLYRAKPALVGAKQDS